MREFKIGDSVLIRTDLVVNQVYRTNNGAPRAYFAKQMTKYKGKKLPFHPKKHETFYYVTVQGDIEEEDFYEGYTFHYLLCKLGKCYKTYKEAEKHVEEDVKFYKNMQKG